MQWDVLLLICARVCSKQVIKSVGHCTESRLHCQRRVFHFLVTSASGELQTVNKMLTECTCSFRKTYDLPCRHVLLLLMAANGMNLITESMMAKGWLKGYQKDALFDISKPTESGSPQKISIKQETNNGTLRTMTPNQKFNEAKRIAIQLASIMSEIGQAEFQELLELLINLHKMWFAGKHVTVLPNCNPENPNEVSSVSQHKITTLITVLQLLLRMSRMLFQMSQYEHLTRHKIYSILTPKRHKDLA